MERMESFVEEIEKPIVSLNCTMYITKVKQWNQQLRDTFMKINERCLNQQQMESIFIAVVSISSFRTILHKTDPSILTVLFLL